MTPKTIRLIVGFLAVFVLISVAPALPDFVTGLNAGQGFELPAISDSILIAIGGSIVLLALVVRRRQAVRAAQPVARTGKALARPSVEQPLKRAMPEHSGPYPTIASPLQIRLRAAVQKGERIPVLARRLNLSIDAVRAAVGASAAATPAARSSTSFRSADPSFPAKPRARSIAGRASRYEATV
jgi:hypothetical protein